MPFDVNAFREAHRPWSLTVGARTFGARHVSAMAVQEFERRYEKAKVARDVHRATQRAWWWVLRRAFPWRPTYAMRGDPVKIILRELEPPARAEALRDFFVCLRGEKSEHPPKTVSRSMSGTRSPQPTPPPAD
jgi:hypothetical protein